MVLSCVIDKKAHQLSPAIVLSLLCSVSLRVCDSSETAHKWCWDCCWLSDLQQCILLYTIYSSRILMLGRTQRKGEMRRRRWKKWDEEKMCGAERVLDLLYSISNLRRNMTWVLPFKPLGIHSTHLRVGQNFSFDGVVCHTVHRGEQERIVAWSGITFWHARNLAVTQLKQRYKYISQGQCLFSELTVQCRWYPASLLVLLTC